MAIEIVRDYFKKFDMDNKILEFPVSSRTVRLAAVALAHKRHELPRPCHLKRTTVVFWL